MAVIKANTEHTRMLARLMRAEAEGEGELGMLMVGNVGVNRVLGECLDFRNIRSIPDMVYQSPGGFEATQKGYFYQRARESEIRLARRAIGGERTHPATFALWFSGLVEAVLALGMTNRTVADSRVIAFSSYPSKLSSVY